MKWERADLRVGFVVLGAAGIAVAALLWLRGATTGERYLADFGATGGLTVQAPVQMQGFTIGRVTDVTPRVVGTRVTFRVGVLIEARLADGRPLPIETGTLAKIQQASVLGNPLIVLEPPALRGERLPPGSVLPTLPPANMMDDMQKLVSDAGGQVATALVRTTALVDSLQGTLRVVRLAADRAALVAESTLVAVPRLVEGVGTAIAHTDSLVQEFRLLGPTAHSVIDSVGAVVPDLRAAARTAATVTHDADPVMRRIIANLDTTSLALKNFSRQLSQHPFKTFFSGVKPP